MDESGAPPRPAGAGWSYWLLGALLVAYVAACSGHRDRFGEADAWEHHRAVVALARDWNPGNPTYARPEPSIRYSPVMVTLAVLCRATGIAPYDALTGAAVVNTALLVVGLRLLLGRFGEARIAATALLTMVALWGGAPGYANSYALSDLPWHQVNPSAFSFALTLIIWSLFQGGPAGRPRRVEVVAAVGLAAVAVLDHPMTGVFALLGLLVLAVADPARRPQKIALAVGIGGAALLLCLAWPWYSFRAAVLWQGDRDYWFNPYILRRAILEWCMPGLALLVVALPMRGRPLVRTCLVGTAAVAGIVALAFAIKSPTFARMILPGMIFVHLPIAAYVHDAGLLAARTWPARLRGLFAPEPGPQAAAGLQCLVALAATYFVAPQLVDIARQPYLGRPWMDRLRGRAASSPSPRPTLERALRPVRPGDVVLSDPYTSWHIPSTSPGRVIAALHFELFVPGQVERRDDLESFFVGGGPDRRRELVRKYKPRWILINTAEPRYPSSQMIDPAAVVVREGPYVLMDADRWLADGGA